MRGLGKSNTATVKKHKILPSRSFSSRQGEGVDKYLRPRALEVFRAGRAFSGLGCLGELGEEAAATQDLVGWLGGVKGGAAGWSEESLYTYDTRTSLICPVPAHVPQTLAGSGWGAPQGNSGCQGAPVPS